MGHPRTKQYKLFTALFYLIVAVLIYTDVRNSITAIQQGDYTHVINMLLTAFVLICVIAVGYRNKGKMQ